jgi:hypothetical protein
VDSLSHQLPLYTTSLLPSSMNPTTARLNRSASDRSSVKLESTPITSSLPKDVDKDTLPQAKIQALEQFVKFGRKGKPKKDHKTVEFPPASWLPTSSDTGSGIDSVPRPDSSLDAHPRTNSTNPRLSPGTLRRRASVNGLNLTNEVNVDAQFPSGTLERRGSSFPGPGVIDNQPGEESAPEPLTLARRIQALLGSYTVPPTPSATDGTTTTGAAPSETAGPATPGGSVSPAPAPINDSRFLALLGNAKIMSGSLDKGRQSVFAILDRLRRPSARATEAPTGSAPSPVHEEAREEAEEYDDGSSIMLYGPIFPGEDSEVELAASDIMSVFDDGESLESEQPSCPLSFVAVGEQLTPRSNRAALPPATSEGPPPQGGTDHTSQHGNQGDQSASGWFDTLKGRVIEGGKLVSEKVAGGTKENVAEGRKVVKTKTRWVPSRDKISFQATWWGYRLCVCDHHLLRLLSWPRDRLRYMPPPVLEVLNNTRLETAKRAAILTAALQWLLGHVPLTVVPPQFRLGFVIAQRLVPYLGYIGAFIAWSWGAMKSFDKGRMGFTHEY